MRYRVRWAGLAMVALGIGVVTVWSMPKMVNASNPGVSAANGGIPVWPWSPLGIAWSPPRFGTVPYNVTIIKDNNLPAGQVTVVTPGETGTTYQVGSVKSVISPPVQATVAEGTATVHVLTVDGHKYEYDKVTTMLTTAYNGTFDMNGPWGAVAAWDGKPLHNGNVAVDPNVIPFGTYLYIDGYGPARAVDSGSAIFGDHIDLFFQESDLKVAEYGIQWHKVYFLTEKPSNYPG